MESHCSKWLVDVRQKHQCTDGRDRERVTMEGEGVHDMRLHIMGLIQRRLTSWQRGRQIGKMCTYSSALMATSKLLHELFYVLLLLLLFFSVWIFRRAPASLAPPSYINSPNHGGEEVRQPSNLLPFFLKDGSLRGRKQQTQTFVMIFL